MAQALPLAQAMPKHRCWLRRKRRRLQLMVAMVLVVMVLVVMVDMATPGTAEEVARGMGLTWRRCTGKRGGIQFHFSHSVLQQLGLALSLSSFCRLFGWHCV